MSEGYQFQVNVWQPSPDTKPVVERHVVHGRVVELGPNWVAEQPSRIAAPDCNTRPRATSEPQPTNTPLTAPPEIRTGNTSNGWTLSRPCPGSHLAQSAKWAAYGNATTTARYRGEPTSLAVLASEMLDLDACPVASFRNTLRPAPLVGAFARYMDRHLRDSDKLRDAASQYAIGAGRMMRGQDIFGTTPMAALVRYVWGASTAGPEAKKAIYRATCAAIAAHVAGREIMTQADLAQAVRETADTEPIP